MSNKSGFGTCLQEGEKNSKQKQKKRNSTVVFLTFSLSYSLQKS